MPLGTLDDTGKAIPAMFLVGQVEAKESRLRGIDERRRRSQDSLGVYLMQYFVGDQARLIVASDIDGRDHLRRRHCRMVDSSGSGWRRSLRPHLGRDQPCVSLLGLADHEHHCAHRLLVGRRSSTDREACQANNSEWVA
jgi:hypothetical protein